MEESKYYKHGKQRESLFRQVYGLFRYKTPINNLWADFKTICLDNLRKHVPSKHTSTRYSQPWCNRNIRRLSRRKQGAFNKYRKTGKKERLGPISPTTEIDPKKNINHHISNM